MHSSFVIGHWSFRRLLLAAALLLAVLAPALRAQVPADVIKESVTIPMRDGFKLEAEVWRFADSAGGPGAPGGSATYPASVISTIYDLDFHRDKFTSGILGDGQIYVGVHMRDAYSNGGSFDFSSYSSAYQATDDAYDIVEWISRQPWSNGRVGFKGSSGNGVGGSAAIWTDHPALKVVSIGHSSSNFHDYWLFLNGVKRDTFGIVGNRNVATTSRAWPRPDSILLDTSEWQTWSARRARQTHVAYIESAGQFDIFEQAAIDNFAALAPHGRAHAHLEPRWHGPAVRRIDGSGSLYNIYTGRPATTSYNNYLNEVFTTPQGSGLHVAIISPSSARYVTAARWPVASTPTSWFLHADGTLQPAAPTAPSASLSYVYDPANPAPNVGGMAFQNGYSSDLTPQTDTYNYGPLNQNIPALTSRSDILRFASAPLAAETTFVGNVEADLHISSTAEDTLFVVKLVAISPDNPDHHALLKDGVFMARHHASPGQPPQRLTPGQIYRLQFKLWTSAVTLPAGWRLAVHVTSSAAVPSLGASKEYLEVHPNTFDPSSDLSSAVVATNTLHLSASHPSRVILPLVALAPTDTTFPLATAAPPTPPYPGPLAVQGEGESFIPPGDTTPSLDEWTDFEEVRKNRQRTRAFLLHNTTGSPLSLGAVPAALTGSAFFTVIEAPASIPAHGSATLRIRYSPTTSGDHSAVVRLAQDQPHAFEFTVAGRARDYAPVLNRPLTPRALNLGETSVLPLPSDTFYAIDNEPLAYAVRRADGSPAPAWVSIDPATGTLAVTPPPGSVGDLFLEITARESTTQTILVAPLRIKIRDPSVTLIPATLPSAPHASWRLLAPAAFASSSSSAVSTGLSTGADIAPVSLAASASWTGTVQIPATAAGGMLVFSFAHTSNTSTAGFTASAETSLDSTNGTDGTWSAHPLALYRPDRRAYHKLQKIDFDTQPRWLRLTVTAPASSPGSVRDLALHQFSADGRDDYWLCVGASLQERGVSHALFKSTIRALTGRDPVLFNVAIGGTTTDDWHTGHPFNPLQAVLDAHPRARYVAFHLGGNNVTDQRPYVSAATDPGDANLAADLDALLLQILEHGKYPLVARLSYRDYPAPDPVNAGANPENGSLPYNLHIVDPLVAAYLPNQYDASRNLPRIDAYTWFADRPQLLSSDGVHLNTTDETLWTTAIWAEMAAPLVYGYSVPTFLAQPASISALEGDRVRLAVSATGPALAYQWFRDGVAVPGATSSFLVLDTLSSANTGTYTVQITSNNGPAIASATAVVAFTPPPASATRRVRLDFGPTATANPSNGEHWNQITRLVTGTAATAGTLLDTTGVAVPGLGLRIDSNFAGNFSADNNSGASSSGYPLNAANDGHYVNGTDTNFNNGVGISKTATLVFTGLDPALAHDLAFYGSRGFGNSTTDPRVARFTVNQNTALRTHLATAFNAANATLSTLAPASDGELRLDVEARDAANVEQRYTYLNVLTLTINLTGETFSAWRDDLLPAATVPTELRAPSADADNDGVPNLLEYFAGLDPLAPGGPAAPFAVEFAATAAGAPAFAFDFRRARDLHAVHHFMVSDDLVTWTVVAPATETVLDPDPDGTGAVELRRALVPAPSGPRAFIRLRVTPY